MQASITTAEREREIGTKPKSKPDLRTSIYALAEIICLTDSVEEQVEYIKCERQAEQIVGYNEIMSSKESAQYRLRGRVVAIDRPLEEILVNHCNACHQL